MSPVLNITEAACYTKLRERALLESVDRGEIPYRKHGKTLLFLRHELDHWLENLPGVKAPEATQNFDTFSDTHEVPNGHSTSPEVTSRPLTRIRSKPGAGRLLGE
jgi:excisionase family DNA binding protein